MRLSLGIACHPGSALQVRRVNRAHLNVLHSSFSIAALRQQDTFHYYDQPTPVLRSYSDRHFVKLFVIVQSS